MMSLGQGKKGPGAPLRRGDACLMCRAKKLKCSAQKPVCDQCTKRKDRCIYDNVRPASRVEKLEKKLAELEEQELREAMQLRRQSQDPFTSHQHPHPFPHPLAFGGSPFLGVGQDNGMPFQADPSANGGAMGYGMDMAMLAGLAGPRGHAVEGQPQGHFVPATPPPTVLNGMGHPQGQQGQMVRNGSSGDVTSLEGWGWPVNEQLPQENVGNGVMMSRGATPGLAGPQDQVQQHFPHMPWALLGSSTNFSSHCDLLVDPTHQVDEIFNAPPTILSSYPSTQGSVVPSPAVREVDTPPVPEDSIQTTPPGGIARSVRGSVATSGGGSFSTQGGQGPQDAGVYGLEMMPPVASQMVDEVMGRVAEFRKEINENDVSQSARDYLLDLFFCPNPPRKQFGSEVFTEVQFRARMLPNAESRPHPCLLFSMYTVAASSSYIPAVRSLAQPLFGIASANIETAIAEQDRLVDTINACKNLSKWLYSRGKVLAGYEMSARAASLCLACGLHQIPSSIFRPAQAVPEPNSSILPPPRSPWELCERIHAFWGVWGNDKGGVVMGRWPSLFKDEIITTPLPRPPEDFVDGSIIYKPDVRLKDAYDLPYQRQNSPLDFFFGFFFFVIHLHHRAVALGCTPPEAQPTYRSFVGSPAGKFSPKANHPAAFNEIMHTTYWLEENMPSEWRTGENEVGWENKDAPLMNLLIICTRIHLHPLNSPYDTATVFPFLREAATLIKSWISHLKAQPSYSPKTSTSALPPSPTDTTGSSWRGSSRNKHGLSGPFHFSEWDYVAGRLVEVGEALKGQGHQDEASMCAHDADAIYEGLRMFRPA
ncbi:hypothetical protein IAT38_002077 [Cryptococcus sp. DSM 104549]